MTRRTFSFAGLAAAAGRGAQARRPNFLFVLADDLGWGDLPCFGHREIVAHGGWRIRGDLRMPHTDRLAREGTRFLQFYVPSAVCSPSRAGLMSGQFPARLGIHDYIASPEQNRKHGVADAMDPRTPTVTRLLRDAGYATGHFGKWHLSAGNKPEPREYGVAEFDPCLKPGARPESSAHIADAVCAIAQRHKGEPFYVNAWLYDPHSPLQPREAAMDAYAEWGTGWKGQRGAFEIYYGVLTEMDRQIGRMLAKLDELGLAEDTVVVFASDNGPETGLIPFTSHYGIASTPGPFRGLKRSLYEGGIRSPLIVRWPGQVPAGRVDGRSLTGGVDWMPSVCRLAGVTAPSCDGEDVSAAWRGGVHARKKPLLWENRFPVYGHVLDQSPMLAARDGDWKLLMNPDRSRVELYDIPRDPGEMTNLAQAQAGVVKRLSGPLLAWQGTLPKGYVHPEAGRSGYSWPAETK
jgi:N-acetylgalactosamine-6-sulfatase